MTGLPLKVVEQRLAPRARISMMARSDTLHSMRPKIRLQSGHPRALDPRCSATT